MPTPALLSRPVRYLLAVAVVGGFLLVATAKYLERTIAPSALAALEGVLATPLETEDFRISLYRHFPYASASFTGVRLSGFPEGEFVTADRITGLVSYYDLLFSDNWVINTVSVSGATARIHRGADRRGNWEVIERRGDTASAGAFSFELSKILLKDVDVDYLDEASEAHVDLHVDQGELAGQFGNEAYVLDGIFSGTSRFAEIGDLRYVEDFGVAADFELAIDPANTSYDFGPSTFTLDGMPVDLTGSFAVVGGAIAYDLELATEQGRIGPLLRALPREWVTPGIRALDSRGRFTLDGSIEGLHDAQQSPAINFVGELDDGALEVPSLQRSADRVSFALEYTNGKARSMAGSKLSLTHVMAELDGQPMHGYFTWSNFADPLYDVNLTGVLPLDWLDETWAAGTLDGELAFRNFRLRGRQRHLARASGARYVRTSGALRLHDAEAVYRGTKIRVRADDLELEGPNLTTRGVVVQAHGDTLTADLDIGNLVPWVLGDSSQVLSFAGAVATPSIELDRWVGMFGEGEPGLGGADADDARPARKDYEASVADSAWARGIAAVVRLRADVVDYRDVHARRFRGSCTLADSRLTLRGEGYAMEGHWELDGEMALNNEPTLGAKLSCSEVNITELFEQTDDFGQDVVQSGHLEGQMTTRAYVEARWDAHGNLKTDELHVWANVGLTDGGLRDFEMLQALSQYVRAEELRDIRFTDTENWIEIADARVYLPAMFIQSSATNFTVAGEHSFAHDIDYAVRVNGAQVLLTKLLGKRPDAEFLPDRRNGWVRTGFKIDGTLEGDAYDVRMAGAQVRRDFRHSQRRKAAIRRKLVGLFGVGSLIDDYDDDGERRAGAPTRTRLTASALRVSTETRDRPSRGSGLVIDDESYIWEEDDRPQSIPSRGAPRPAVTTAADTRPTTRTGAAVTSGAAAPPTRLTSPPSSTGETQTRIVRASDAPVVPEEAPARLLSTTVADDPAVDDDSAISDDGAVSDRVTVSETRERPAAPPEEPLPPIASDDDDEYIEWDEPPR